MKVPRRRRIIKEMRLRKNWSQEQLAQKLGITRQSISMWETGMTDPQGESLTKLAKVFSIPREELVEILSKERMMGELELDPAVNIQLYKDLTSLGKENIEGLLATQLVSDNTAYFAVRITSGGLDSVHLPNGSIAIIRRQSIVDNDKLALVQVGEKYKIARIHVADDIMTLSDDGSQERYDLSKNTIRIIGKVVAFQGVY